MLIPELGEDLVQVVLDRLATNEQLGRDVLVSRAVARHPRDSRLGFIVYAELADAQLAPVG